MGVMMLMLLSLKRAILVDIFYRGVSSDQITPNLADCEKGNIIIHKIIQ